MSAAPKEKSNSGQVSQDRMLLLALVPLGIGLNLALGTVTQALKLSVYLDTVGTILVTILLGARAGVLVGVLSFLIGGALTNPVLPWFSGTQAAVALYGNFVARRGLFRNFILSIGAGIGMGIVAGVVSAPVIVYLFGGVTGSGSSLITAFLLKTGQGMFKAVLYSGLACEPLDKTLCCLLAVWLLRGLPRSLLKRFRGGSLVQNGFIKS